MSNTVKDLPYKLLPDNFYEQYPADRDGGKCRCPICGKKNAGKNRPTKLYRENGICKDESGRYIDFGNNKRAARKLLRARMKRELINWNMEEG
jgi:hypothetical protein